MNNCEDCNNHVLVKTDFCREESVENYSHEESHVSDGENEFGIRFYQWQKGENGYISKIHIKVPLNEALTRLEQTIRKLKEHIHTKRIQQSEIKRLKETLKFNEILVHLDYSENYKSKDQNEVQRAYFGHSTFSLFTACPYFRSIEHDQIKTMPTTITCEASDKSRIASITCVNKVINHVLSRIENNIDTIYIVSDGCAS